MGDAIWKLPPDMEKAKLESGCSMPKQSWAASPANRFSFFDSTPTWAGVVRAVKSLTFYPLCDKLGQI
jgi:hypothetical protein